jgi:hypothetical protein
VSHSLRFVLALHFPVVVGFVDKCCSFKCCFCCHCCSQAFLIYLCLRLAGVSYGQFVAVRFGFNLSTYI